MERQPILTVDRGATRIATPRRFAARSASLPSQTLSGTAVRSQKATWITVDHPGA
jgi:hypothetical protein